MTGAGSDVVETLAVNALDGDDGFVTPFSVTLTASPGPTDAPLNSEQLTV